MCAHVHQKCTTGGGRGMGGSALGGIGLADDFSGFFVRSYNDRGQSGLGSVAAGWGAAPYKTLCDNYYINLSFKIYTQAK